MREEDRHLLVLSPSTLSVVDTSSYPLSLPAFAFLIRLRHRHCLCFLSPSSMSLSLHASPVLPFLPFRSRLHKPRLRCAAVSRNPLGEVSSRESGGVRLGTNHLDSENKGYAGQNGRLEPLYDDGFGDVSVKDYFDAARAINEPDGGPPRWFCPVECGAPIKGSPLLLFLPGRCLIQALELVYLFIFSKTISVVENLTNGACFATWVWFPFLSFCRGWWCRNGVDSASQIARKVRSLNSIILLVNGSMNSLWAICIKSRTKLSFFFF